MGKGRGREVLIYPSAHPQALARVWTAVYQLNVGAKSSSARSRGDSRGARGCTSNLYTRGNSKDGGHGRQGTKVQPKLKTVMEGKSLCIEIIKNQVGLS